VGGRKKIEIPPHLPHGKRVIEPENGTICTCGCGMRRIGEQIIERLLYKRRPGRYGGKPAVVVENLLDWQFQVNAPDRVWVADIIYIKTYEGWLYLSVVIDLFLRRVVGWSARSRMTTDLALQSLLAAVWRRKPKRKVMATPIRGLSSQAESGNHSCASIIWKPV